MADVFINEQIFDSDGDYILGGFHSDKSGFTYNDFAGQFSARIEKLVQEYIDRATVVYAGQGIENPQDKALESLSLVINDNLGFRPEFATKETIVDDILNDDRSVKWLSEIRDRVHGYENSKTDEGIVNKNGSGKLSIQEEQSAVYFTDEVTLEIFIEQLSSIEL